MEGYCVKIVRTSEHQTIRITGRIYCMIVFDINPYTISLSKNCEDMSLSEINALFAKSTDSLHSHVHFA